MKTILLSGSASELWSGVQRPGLIVAGLLALLCLGTARAATDCAQVSMPTTQCEALLEFWQSTGGSAWADATSNQWGVSNTPCRDWAGVSCNRSGLVTHLERSAQNLTGTLLASISQLTELQALYLGQNHLTGPLPTTLGDLVQLTDLALEKNQIVGSVPTTLTQLTALSSLDLSYNGLFSDNASLISFLNGLQSDWQATQTVPPALKLVEQVGPHSLLIHWNPILYTADAGYYQAFYAETSTGPYLAASGVTADKTIDNYQVDNLTAGKTYYFQARSYTAPHSPQENEITSGFRGIASGVLGLQAPIEVFATPVTGSDSQIEIHWQDAANQATTGFAITRLPDNQTWQVAGSLSSDVDRGLSCQTSYSYQISAIGATGESPASSSNTVTLPCATPAFDLLLSTSSGDTPLTSGQLLDFGSNTAGASIPMRLLLRNEGQGVLYLSPPVVPDGFSLSGSFPAELAAGQQLQALLQFTAQTVGSYSGTLAFPSNDATLSPFKLDLQGTLVSASSSAIYQEIPVDISLNQRQIATGLAADSLVGVLDVTVGYLWVSGAESHSSSGDSLSGGNHRYSLVGELPDHVAFHIDDQRLLTSRVLSYPQQSLYRIRIRVQNDAGYAFEKEFSIQVTPAAQTATGLSLSNQTISEQQPAGTAIGWFTTVGATADTTLSYSLVAGEGDTDNQAFVISDNLLLSAQVFDYATQSSHSLRVQSQDSSGHTLSAAFVIQVLPISEAIQAFSVGWRHQCVLRQNNGLACEGWDNLKQRQVPTSLNFSRLSSGTNHSCALRLDGTLACWGDNRFGQTQVPAGSDFIQVSAGGSHSCALKRDGSAQCWGYNFEKQSNPVSNTRFVQISAGGFHTCALTQEAGLQCWGGNNYGQANPPSAQDFVQVSSGDYHSCALHKNGAVSCWGDNHYGQAQSPAGQGYLQVSAGEDHSCALTTAGVAQCWGSNSQGQSMPPTGGHYRSLSVGGQLSCGLGDDSRLVCWGRATK